MPYKSKEDQAKAGRRHYLKNIELIKARAAKYRKKAWERNKLFIWEYLSKNPCVDCGEADPVVLQFDHIGPKKFNLADAAKGCYSIESIKKEIEKCCVRCANCHTRKTAKEVNSFSHKRGKPAPKNTIIMKHIISIIFIMALAWGAQAQTWQVDNGRTTWSWNATEEGRPGIDLLVGYKIKTAFGARIVFGSILVNTTALNIDAKPDQLLNDLIAELGKAGLLEGVKGLDRPERASITILSWEAVRPGFVYTTEQPFTPNTPE